MIYVRITEGLGNQLFKYACAYALSQRTGDRIGIDVSGYAFRPRAYMLNSMNITGEVLDFPVPKNDSKVSRALAKARKMVLINKSGKCKIVSERVDTRMRCYPYDFSYSSNIYIDGYWQTPKYFGEYRKELLQEFSPKKGVIGSLCQEKINELKSHNSVAIHIRRGDYMAAWLLSEKFYLEAIDIITNKIEKPHFYIFCEDAYYVKGFATKINNAIPVSLISGFTDIEEFYLISNCKHQIIANSTFSWWAAYLNSNENAIVVAPLYKQWRGEYYPENWICIEAEGEREEEDAKD